MSWRLQYHDVLMVNFFFISNFGSFSTVDECRIKIHYYFIIGTSDIFQLYFTLISGFWGQTPIRVLPLNLASWESSVP